jgi:hypothetical protein
MADDSSSIEDNIATSHINLSTGITTVTLTPATRAQEAQVRYIRFLVVSCANTNAFTGSE